MDEPRNLKGRVALVTGVSRQIGIGAAVAARMLADGAHVFATGWNAFDAEMPWGADRDGTESLLQQLSASRDRLEYAEADFEDPNTPAEMIRRTIEHFGRIDIVVANHARSSHQSVDDVTAEELDRCWAVNARASILLAQAMLHQRQPGPGGRLILFTSGQHIGPMPQEVAYSVTKGAIHQMTATLSDVLIDRGITVNCINPGPVDTGYAVGDSHRQVAAMFPGGRWGTPEGTAGLVSWLVSDEAEWMTGEIHNHEGGFRRWARIELEREH